MNNAVTAFGSIARATTSMVGALSGVTVAMLDRPSRGETRLCGTNKAASG